MSSDTSTKALTSMIATGGLYALSQTAFRFGARRLGAVLFGGTFVGIATSLFLLFDAISTAPSPVSATQELRGGCEMEEQQEPTSTCMICQRSASDFSCTPRKSDTLETTDHAFCKSCFNVYAKQGLLAGGFFEQDETSPSGRVSLPGEMPCPMFGQGCSCSALPLTVLRNNLSSENMELLNIASERIAMQLSLETYGAKTTQGVRQRNFASS